MTIERSNFDYRIAQGRRIVVGVTLLEEDIYEIGMRRMPWESILYDGLGHHAEEAVRVLARVIDPRPGRTDVSRASNDSLCMLATALVRAFRDHPSEMVQWLRIPHHTVTFEHDRMRRGRVITFHAELQDHRVVVFDPPPTRPYQQPPRAPEPALPPPDPGPAPTERELTLRRERPAPPVEEVATRRRPKKR